MAVSDLGALRNQIAVESDFLSIHGRQRLLKLLFGSSTSERNAFLSAWCLSVIEQSCLKLSTRRF